MTCWCKGSCPYIAAPRDLITKGNAGRAHFALRNILTNAPLCVEANLAMAGVLCRGNKAYAAIAHIDRAAVNGDPARILQERAQVLRSAMRLDESIKTFAEAQKAAPDNPQIAAGFVNALEVAGHLKEARELVMAARAQFPADTALRTLHAVILDGLGEAGAAAELLEPNTTTPMDLTPIEWLDRGRYLEKMGRYSEAWDSWMTGKSIFRDKFHHRYDAPRFAAQTARLAKAAEAPRPNFVRRAPLLEHDPAPVFICGFPRSGTTLLETILSSHSAIVAGDELSGISDVIDMLPSWLKVRVPYPDAMLASSLGENSNIPSLLRDFYLREARERIGAGFAAKGRKRVIFFTDKMPLNEIHLPLIRMLFPTAPVFRMQRHPLDVMVSCMSNWLVHGGFYASSLEACATHYKAVDDVVQHYDRAFKIQDRTGLTSLRYESLVDDTASKIGAVLSGLGLAMQPACLAFHKNKRRARTLSYRQVQKPINAAGVGRWKHFRDQLAPAVEILKPILERENYEY